MSIDLNLFFLIPGDSTTFVVELCTAVFPLEVHLWDWDPVPKVHLQDWDPISIPKLAHFKNSSEIELHWILWMNNDCVLDVKHVILQPAFNNQVK